MATAEPPRVCDPRTEFRTITKSGRLIGLECCDCGATTRIDLDEPRFDHADGCGQPAQVRRA